MDETDFLYNDFTGFDKKELEKIIKTISKKPVKPDVKAAFLKRFSYEVFNAYRKGKHKKIAAEEKPKEKIVVEKPIIKPEIKRIVLEEPPKPIFKKILPVKEILSNEGIVIKSAYKDGIYNLIEPKLEKEDSVFLKEIEKNLSKQFIKNKKILSDKDYIKKEIDKLAKKKKFAVPLGYYEKIQYYLARDILNFGKIDGLLRDIDVKEIICDGLNKPIKVNFKGEEAISDVVFTDKEELDSLIKKFASLANKKISEKEPFLSAVLPSGLRIQASLSSSLSDARFVVKK